MEKQTRRIRQRRRSRSGLSTRRVSASPAAAQQETRRLSSYLKRSRAWWKHRGIARRPTRPRAPCAPPLCWRGRPAWPGIPGHRLRLLHVPRRLSEEQLGILRARQIQAQPRGVLPPDSGINPLHRCHHLFCFPFSRGRGTVVSGDGPPLIRYRVARHGDRPLSAQRPAHRAGQGGERRAEADRAGWPTRQSGHRPPGFLGAGLAAFGLVGNRN